MISPLSAFRRLYPIVRDHRGLAVGFIVITLLASATEGIGVGLAIPLLEGGQGDGGGANWDIPFLGEFARYFHSLPLVERIRHVAVALFFIVLLQGALRYLERLVALRLENRVDRTLKQEVIEQLYRVSLSFIHRQPIGTLLTVLGMHTRQAAGMVTTLTGAVASLSILAVYTALMLALSWQLTLTAGVLLVLLTFLSKIINAFRLREAGKGQIAYQQRMGQVVVENLSLIKLTHLYARERQAMARCREAIDGYLGHFYESQRLIHRAAPLFNITAVLGLCLLLIAGAMLMPGETENWLARTVLFLVIVFRLLGPATSLNRVHAELTNAYPGLESVLELLDPTDKPYLKNGSIPFVALKDAIRLEDVTFRYGHQEAPVLKNVTFTIPKGKMTAIVGPSGSGKSTIVDLVARLYDCGGGRIRIDEADLRALDIASWRRRIAVVSQDTLLFNDTLIENLRFARPDARDEEVHHAARLAQLDAFARSLPQGYDTLIGDRGVRLSGGQQQRVASALDAETEQAIKVAIDTFCHGRTLLVAAHRLSTIRNADKIVVIENARVAEEGTHAQLMRRNGPYRRLVDTQTLVHPPKAY